MTTTGNVIAGVALITALGATATIGYLIARDIGGKE